MEEPLEHAYFEWLCAKVVRVRVPTPSLTYFKLLNVLQRTEFVWLIPGDDNRAEDGVDLRKEFLRESGHEPEHDFHVETCSVLEMMIALAIRAAFDTEETHIYWFWTFVENLDLARWNDASNFNESVVSDILYRLVWRTYDEYGQGGMCPLEFSENDQRKVEIWYQFCEYLTEHEE